jgi:hypothetical protein
VFKVPSDRYGDSQGAQLGPNRDGMGPAQFISLADLRQVIASKAIAILYNRIDYFDVFSNKPKYTEVTQIIHYHRPYETLLEKKFDGAHFSFLTIGDQNTSN